MKLVVIRARSKPQSEAVDRVQRAGARKQALIAEASKHISEALSSLGPERRPS